MDKSDNPFRAWTNQVRSLYACDIQGQECGPRSPRAIAWCALGWMEKQGFEVGDGCLESFNAYLCKTEGRPIATLNDVIGWTPDEFAAAWERWLDAPIDLQLPLPMAAATGKIAAAQPPEPSR